MTQARLRGDRTWTAFAAILVLVFSLLPPERSLGADATDATPADVQVDANVIEAIERDGRAPMLLVLDDRPDLSEAEKIDDWAERGRFVYETLRDHAAASQADLVADLDRAGAEFTTFWIANVVLVEGDLATLDRIMAHDEVVRVELAEGFRLPEPEFVETTSQIQATEWNLDAINAPEAWDQYDARGQNIVVGILDSGVDFTHPALVDNYRGNLGNGEFDHAYNWFDPSRVCDSPLVPCDNNGHGTHVTGSVLGDDGAGNQIGVAPAATWIAAKGCESRNCSDFALLSSGQWMLAPTDLSGENPDPAMRPHVINNSWGGAPGNDWYMQMVDNWIAAGIFPQFASGNPGPWCGLAGSPGDYPQSYSAGAFDRNGLIYNESGRGPSAIDGSIKPNLTAPGVEVRSSLPGGGYGEGTGTSMASPHVAGAVAALWSVAPDLIGNIEETRNILDVSAADGPDTADLTCGGEATDNNVWGEGKLDVLAAVEQAPRGETGIVAGVVVDASTSDPVAGATVEISGELDRTIVTDADGHYSATLSAGTYEVTASYYGYETASTSITVIADQVTDGSIELTPIPTTTVTGVVTDAAQGWPLYAAVDVEEAPGDPVFTDPITGEFSIDVANGIPVVLSVSAIVEGYQIVEREVLLPDDGAQQDFQLEADPSCTALGYEENGGTCVPQGGGLVLGEVHDLRTGEPIVGALLTVADDPEAAASTGVYQTDDPAYGDGLFVLHTTATGTVDVTASMHLYADETQSVEVAEGGAVAIDFVLDSGLLEVDSAPLEATVDLGGTETVEVQVTNVGELPVDFQLGVREPSFAPVSHDLQEAAAGSSTFVPEGTWSVEAETVSTSAPQWTPGPDLPAPLVRYAPVQCPGQVDGFYVLTGLGEDIVPIPVLWQFDGRTGTWTELAPAPNAREENLTAVCTGETIHLLGGGVYAGSFPHHYVYDIATDTWSEAAPPPRATWGAESAYWDGRVYLIGGGRTPAFGPVSDEVNVFDIESGKWVDNETPMPEALGVPGVVQVGQYVFVVGGWVLPGPDGTHSAATYRLDLESGEWTIGPDLNHARGEIAVTATDTALYAIGGSLPGQAPNSGSTIVERLDYTDWPNGSWEQLDDLPLLRGVGRGGFCTELRTGQEIWAVGGGSQFITDLTYYEQVHDGSCAQADPPGWVVYDESVHTIQPGETLELEVTLDGSVAEVDQPGLYQAEIVVRSDTPELTEPIPVAMRVRAPEGWSRVSVDVEGLDRCDRPGRPLANALVTVDGAEASPAGAGEYARWLPAGTYGVVVEAFGFVSQEHEMTVAPGEDASFSVRLRPEAPCVEVDPVRLDLTVESDTRETVGISVTNTGPVDAWFQADEVSLQIEQAPIVEADIDDSSRTDTDLAYDENVSWADGVSNASADGSTQVEIEWEAGTALPAPLVRGAHAQCPGDHRGFYVFSGVASNAVGAEIVDDSWWFDAESASWEALAPIPVGGEGVRAVCTGTHIHVMGGGKAGGTNRHFIYDIENDTWSEGAPLPRDVWGAAVGEWAGRIYLVGGNSVFQAHFGNSDRVDVYDIATDSWIGQASPMPIFAGALGYAQVDNYLYVVGGWSWDSTESNVRKTFRFDMQTGEWEEGPDLNVGRGDLAVVATDSALYALGGNPDGSAHGQLGTDAVERLDLSEWPNGEWELYDSLPSSTVALNGGACTQTGTGARIWAIGGAVDGMIADNNFYEDRPEQCAGGTMDVPWLSVGASGVKLPSDSGSTVLEVTVDSSGLQPGAYEASILLRTSDTGASHIAIPVLLTVEEDEGPGTGEPGPEEPGPEEPGPEEPGIEDPEEPADEWQEPDPAFRFGDVPEGHVFEYEAHWLAANDITRGCNPPDNDRFCPEDPVTRGQMAAFLVRALHLPVGSKVFVDTSGHLFEKEVAALATSDVTRGCNPPDNDRFCPDDLVTRGEMAAFLTRALDLDRGTDSFQDATGHLFEGEIAALAASGITRGCNPPDNDRFCPDAPVTRGQMAAFLYRALTR